MVVEVIKSPRAGGMPGRPGPGPDMPDIDRPDFESDVPDMEEEDEE